MDVEWYLSFQFVILTILSVQLNSIKYIYIVAQQISITFSFCKTETIPIKKPFPISYSSPALCIYHSAFSQSYCNNLFS